jgi:hypothetical protein
MNVESYAKLHNITPQAVLYRIKKKKIKATKNQYGKWDIKVEQNPTPDADEEYSKDTQIALLKQEIEYLKKEVEDKNNVIEAERRTNIALISSIETIKQSIEQKENNKPGFFSQLFRLKKVAKT